MTAPPFQKKPDLLQNFVQYNIYLILRWNGASRRPKQIHTPKVSPVCPQLILRLVLRETLKLWTLQWTDQWRCSRCGRLQGCGSPCQYPTTDEVNEKKQISVFNQRHHFENIGKCIVIKLNMAINSYYASRNETYQVANAIVGVVRCRECNAELGHPN